MNVHFRDKITATLMTTSFWVELLMHPISHCTSLYHSAFHSHSGGLSLHSPDSSLDGRRGLWLDSSARISLTTFLIRDPSGLIPLE